MYILLVEDDVETARFIEKAMTENAHILHHEDNGADGYELAMRGNYDVIIADRMLPRLDGLEMIKRLREQNNYTPIIILSALDEVSNRIEGIRAGADDYLTKPFSFAELLVRVEALARRQPMNQCTNPEKKTGDLTLNRISREVYRGNDHISLSTTEFNILDYLMIQQDKLVTRTMLLEKVWGISAIPPTNFVNVHISRIRNKIDKGYDHKYLLTVRGMGYILQSEDENAGK